jgi:signal transduction histidine kinase
MRWCLFSSKGLVNEHGKVLFVMSTIQDISEYKQSETDTMQIISHFEYRIAEFINEIEHLQSQMQFSEEYKQKFIETASHEFRTPLSIIQTNCEIIQRYGSDVLGSEAITRRFQTIYKSVRQLTDLLDSALGIDRVIRRENNDTSGLPLPSSNTGHPMFSDQKELRTSIISPSIVVKTETPTNTVMQEKQERNDQLLHLPEENTKILIHDLQNPLASIMLTSSSLERNWNKMPLPDFMKSLQSIGHHGRRMNERNDYAFFGYSFIRRFVFS